LGTGGDDRAVRGWCDRDGLLGEPVEKQPSGLRAAPVEPKGEFVEVVVEMLVPDAALIAPSSMDLPVLRTGGKQTHRASADGGCNPGIKSLPLKGAVVTGDAAFTFKTIVDAILHRGADYFLFVKANQPELRAELARAFGDIPP
jgi:hypothetical protein